ncbi:hypothetical protein BA177_14990 [Woeseia oceani]|uniref:DUF4064 domain-containing protein n=1 Tax=Woeseia oceani TaxID=1548547 RepID=A0A193LIL5_9GAMM|nr:hypothetical protein BA177_14990 [Woeseia oceani]
MILGIVGGLVAGALGMKWLGDFGQLNEMQLAAGGEQLQNMGTAGLLMIVSLILGVTGGIMAWKRKYLPGGVLMLVGGIVPLFYAKQAILFLCLLIAGGIVALLAHYKSASPASSTSVG